MSKPQEKVLVTGATGSTGSALLDLLVKRGAPVRVMVRREADRGRFANAESVVADFDDGDAVAAAPAGIDRARGAAVDAGSGRGDLRGCRRDMVT